MFGRVQPEVQHDGLFRGVGRPLDAIAVLEDFLALVRIVVDMHGNIVFRILHLFSESICVDKLQF